MFRTRHLGRTWRAIVAGAAAYALALNVILAGMTGAAAVATSGGDPSGFEICLSHGSNPGAPTQPIDGKLHCLLCLVGTHAPVLPADAFVAVAFAPVIIVILGGADDGRPPATIRDPGKPPRGPPLTA